MVKIDSILDLLAILGELLKRSFPDIKLELLACSDLEAELKYLPSEVSYPQESIYGRLCQSWRKVSDTRCQGNLHGHVRVDSLVSHVLTNTHKENLDLLLRPVVDAGQRCESHSFSGIHEVVEVPLANSLVVLILGPWVRRPLEVLLEHAFESNIDHLLPHLRDRREPATKLFRSFSNERNKLSQRLFRRQSVIIGSDNEL